MFEKYQSANNVIGFLDAGISTGGTQLIIKTEYKDLFPSHNGTTDRDYLLTIEHLADDFSVLKREIVRVIGKNGNVFMITRSAGYCPASDTATAQTNTAFSFLNGDKVVMNITAENDKDIKDELVRQNAVDEDIYANGNNRLKAIRAKSGTQLMIDIGAGNFLVGASEGYYSGGEDIAVMDNATNYVMIDGAGTIRIANDNWSSLYTRIATVICADGVITSIVDNRIDILGGPISSLDIYGMNMKTPLSLNDAFVISDSDDLNINKKTLIRDIYNMTRGFYMPGTQFIGRYSDNPYFMSYVSSNATIQLHDLFGSPLRRLGVQQSMACTSILGSSNCYGTIIHNNRIVASIYLSNNTYMYSCSIGDDITIVGNWTLDFTIPTSGMLYINGFDGTYFCFSLNQVNKDIYRWTPSGTQGTILTFSNHSGTIIGQNSAVCNGKYALVQSSPNTTINVFNANGDRILPASMGDVFGYRATFRMGGLYLVSADGVQARLDARF